MPLMNLLFESRNPLVVVDVRFILTSREFTYSRQLLNFYQLIFPEFDVNVLKALKDFQSDQIQRISFKVLTAHYAFEFDTIYRNDYWIHFSNNQFINRILGGMLDLP